ncbi:hypothetical protein GH714_039282 [Hevea brasiliensis]|uniref:DNA mismatch repair proteins mutS family domain-containing protein n=1 Tax=Hevea brasiliensis TaxID=3981 RepID=A0A6A6LGF3_HEVBR|nr:hypothetical protein GH714_039282 [Hevea brasiliensis]
MFLGQRPGVLPLVPRLKRIQEDGSKFDGKNGLSLLNAGKRVKLLLDSTSPSKNHDGISDSTTKFEWLDPLRIRDANGRRPSDPLYDKKTLYIPADALKKMSASQKQYWSVKSQYMDVVLFFKVGKFYELYELDAEIGHKELDWKMTLSGVGKCRQVGISESGIDDAVEKLVARGYKVGRIEQLETSDQAKARGANSVIPRKLVQVVTPSTLTDGNIGPDAVHLLAIKEGNYGLDNGATVYGFAFVDCAALRFWVGSVNDDTSFAALGALLMQVSPREVIYESRGMSKEAQKALRKYSLTGSTTLQLTPVPPTSDFLDASEVRNLIQSKGYLRGSSNPWNNALDSVMNHDTALCALGGLIDHLSRLMVKVFGSLVKGLRIGMDLLLLLEEEGKIMSLLSKNFTLPELSGSAGLGKFLAQFEAAVDSEFPNYQNHDVTESEAETLSVLIELFIEKSAQWSEMIHAINCIDVLRSFAITASMSSGSMSRPVILPESKTAAFTQETRGPVLKIKGLWHPFALGENGGLPVPNDLHLGEDSGGYHPCTLLLTGPNMGGKSTLLRATCLAVILAQLGCFVPGEKCVLSVVDVIFTRLGATDRIMTGESTFFIECTETASVLQNATQDSLVLLDELVDRLISLAVKKGHQIFVQVFCHLVEKVNCRLLFATHYHPLTKEFASHPHVTLQHMACAVKSKSENYSEGDQDLVFLYRLASGACPESYGLQVAIMAGIPEMVVDAASKAGQVMKKSIGESFNSSEQRSEFSTLHEDWLKTLLNVSQIGDCNFDNDDVYDTLFCLWHEVKSSYQPCK